MYTIDAQNKSLGRVASEAAKVLMGKDKADYKPNVVADVKVEIKNASKIKINPKNLDNKLYKRYSGYPGGLKETPMKKVIEKKGYSELFEMAVRGMLPANRLRQIMLKNLSIVE
ncbi:50S ribosomal protein L13 [Patescibacteria group bacterium]